RACVESADLLDVSKWNGHPSSRGTDDRNRQYANQPVADTGTRSTSQRRFLYIRRRGLASSKHRGL
ncbi:TPA: hypothetical protein ACXM9H_005878, partial [Burkholderia multivorans]